MPDNRVFASVQNGTIQIPATTTSVNAALPFMSSPPVNFASGGSVSVRVVNNGSSPCRIKFGTDNTTAITKPTSGSLSGSTYSGGTAGSKLILANSVEVLSLPDGTTYVAVGTDSGTTTMEFTVGSGF